MKNVITVSGNSVYLVENKIFCVAGIMTPVDTSTPQWVWTERKGFSTKSAKEMAEWCFNNPLH
jgi:hypothetical protein